MNVEQLKKQVGAHLHIRPEMRHLDDVGVEQPVRDDKWSLDRIENGFLHLRHVPTDRVVKLGTDNVQEFRTPDFLILRCELTFHPARGITLEPIIGGAPRSRRAVQVQAGKLTGRRIRVVPGPGEGIGDAGKTGEIVSVAPQKAPESRRQRIVEVRLDVSPHTTTNYYPYQLRFVDGDAPLPERPDPESDL